MVSRTFIVENSNEALNRSAELAAAEVLDDVHNGRADALGMLSGMLWIQLNLAEQLQNYSPMPMNGIQKIIL